MIRLLPLLLLVSLGCGGKPEPAAPALPAVESTADEEAKHISELQAAGGTAHRLGKDKPVSRVSFAGEKTTDAALAVLKQFPKLEAVEFRNCPNVTDAGAVHLAALPGLTTLSLNGTKVGDTGLSSLAGLAKLKLLTLHRAPITDAGLAHLAALKSLQTLELDGTPITDAGLAHLAALPDLREVFARDTRTTDVGAKRLEDAVAAGRDAKIPRPQVTVR